MNDMTTCFACARPIRPVRRIRPKPAPLLLLPEWRVELPVVTAAPPVDPREGRARALAAKASRKAAAFQPVDTVLLNPDFRARVEAIAARRGGTLVCGSPVVTARPLAAG